MASRDNAVLELTPEVLLKAYACGIFPMAENADDPALFWIDPEERGIIPLDAFHVPGRLARTVRARRDGTWNESSGMTPRSSGSIQNSAGSSAFSAMGKMPHA